MILILGREDDLSTTNVCEWLYHYNAKFFVLNTDDDHSKIKIDYFNFLEKKFLIRKKGIEYNLFDVNVVWNRRHGLDPKKFTNTYVTLDSQFFPEEKNKFHYHHTLEETRTLFEFIHHFIESNVNYKLGSFFANDVNKLVVLQSALAFGLKIPDSYILSTKKDLIEKINLLSPKRLITKPLTQGVYNAGLDGKYQYYNYVNAVEIDFVNEVEEVFFPSLFQEEIEKQLELRIFFLEDDYYSMAIFSQENETSKQDFRQNEYWNEPLRCVPFDLPHEIVEKLKSLMKKLKLNTGSIDMILTPEFEYVFLEVNPCGQFIMTSEPCNYNLEQKVALKLLHYDKR
ncbi:grasp-with-spasm system ATP-grasp peptide maturase [Myroides pelagicus]|uniref:Grasp-with-spasm system ATP-grasp peptide maturase n=1 Tax=Myroides pelagicus TaxID=270914 RepID=A0A7K1GQ31_9FLAO|nr:grasp-with-spasm system ATP-grasp peptide maturase [Myroides pelagicus]MTH31015.1 grasp-with-spasm system ATP-grasp peptide maturase [Myroides pelagicus]